jgi:hypothetical protein
MITKTPKQIMQEIAQQAAQLKLEKIQLTEEQKNQQAVLLETQRKVEAIRILIWGVIEEVKIGNPSMNIRVDSFANSIDIGVQVEKGFYQMIFDLTNPEAIMFEHGNRGTNFMEPLTRTTGTVEQLIPAVQEVAAKIIADSI